MGLVFASFWFPFIFLYDTRDPFMCLSGILIYIYISTPSPHPGTASVSLSIFSSRLFLDVRHRYCQLLLPPSLAFLLSGCLLMSGWL